MPNDPVQEAIDQATRACNAAVAATPEPYRGFITFISQNKRVGGTRQQPLYATIKNPYMTVDGRVKWAMDDHREKGAKLSITTEFVTEPTTGQLLCKATVLSDIYGMVTGHARAFVGGTGVNETNPIENSETSACGRALGFMGYGLYGSGIASADEVETAMSQRGNGTAEPKQPTPRQIAFLRDIMEQQGIQQADIEQSLAELQTAEQASKLIDTLRNTGAAESTLATQAEPDDVPDPPVPDMTGGDPDDPRRKAIRKMFAVAKEQGIDAAVFDAWCHLMSGRSRSTWSIKDVEHYLDDLEEGFRGKSIDDLQIMAAHKVDDLLTLANIGEDVLSRTLAAMGLPDEPLYDQTIPALYKIADMARNVQANAVASPPDPTPEPVQPELGDGVWDGRQPTEASPDTVLCPIHAEAMTKRGPNRKGYWYSHKVGNAWCNGYERQ